MYKRIITYNFENDETRDAFVEFLGDLGFEDQPDQSTYAQKVRNPRGLDELKAVITDWSSDKNLSENDSVQIYCLYIKNQKYPWIIRHDLRYNVNHGEFREVRVL